jgi:hypothetical protein
MYLVAFDGKGKSVEKQLSRFYGLMERRKTEQEKGHLTILYRTYLAASSNDK